jgi:ribosomal-protein-serine acetyltransferase
VISAGVRDLEASGLSGVANVSIRPYRPSDAYSLFEAARASIPAIFSWLLWCHCQFTTEEGRDWIARQVEAWCAGTGFEFLIVSSSDTLLGGCGLNHLDVVNRRANPGYRVGAGRGYCFAIGIIMP